MTLKSTPSLALSTAVVMGLIALWAYIRLYLFRELFFPLTYVLPLLVCVWTRRPWQLWTLCAAFCAMAMVKYFFFEIPTQGTESFRAAFAATMFNILFGTGVVRAIMTMGMNLEQRNEIISAQNVELEAQSEELSQQNEEIRAQSEELAQQNEEIESQSEELERQNDELQSSNERLSSREEMLQTIILLSRDALSTQEVLESVCSRALKIVGEPGEVLAVLELKNDALEVRAQCSHNGLPPIPKVWTLDGSLAKVVLEEDRTAYVDDLQARPDLAAPFGTNDTIRSLLVTPMRIGGTKAGALMVASTKPAHWTPEQFQILEWVAAQCALTLESLQWQHALRDRAQEVEAANQAKDQFLAMLSHELRTPLTPILAAAGSLEHDTRLPDDVRQDVAMIRRNVSIQSRLMDDLLDLTRITRGKLDLHPQLLSITRVLRESAAIVTADLDAKEQQLSIQLDVPRKCAIIGDDARLQQVFWNLLKNAIKFSPPRSHISLSARCDDQPEPKVVITVSDTGIGFDSSNHDRIFKPFEQVTSHERPSPGLGLGLAIAKAVVEMHDGIIYASSPGLGQGATFTVELPQAHATEPLPANDPPAPAFTNTPSEVVSKRPFHILLVEDHSDTSLLLERLLRIDGHTVSHASDIAGAMKIFGAGNTFDLILSDLGLPDGSGLDFMREIRARGHDVPAICLSGFGTESDLQSSREAGFIEHLIKPIELQQLHAAIGRVNAGRTDT